MRGAHLGWARRDLRGAHLGWARHDVRGAHIGWARPAETATPEATVTQPVQQPAEAAPVRVVPQGWAAGRLPRLPQGPSAVGRLIALIVSFGLAWALLLALAIWAITLLVG